MLGSVKGEKSENPEGEMEVGKWNNGVSPKHPPNLEYITAIEAACSKLS